MAVALFPRESDLASVDPSRAAVVEPSRALRVAHKGSRIEAPAFLRMWHLTSLDAPTVAVVWTLAAAWAVRVWLPVWVPALLGLGAWTVYIGDRLLDGMRGQALRERHLFHQRHRRAFVAVGCSAGLAVLSIVVHAVQAQALWRVNRGAWPRLGPDVALTDWLPDMVRAAVLLAALAYFFAVHAGRRLPLPKELLVGVIFTLACFVPAALGSSAVPPSSGVSGMLSAIRQLWLPGLFFAALAWLNCHAIERWERAQDGGNAGNAADSHSNANSNVNNTNKDWEDLESAQRRTMLAGGNCAATDRPIFQWGIGQWGIGRLGMGLGCFGLVLAALAWRAIAWRGAALLAAAAGSAFLLAGLDRMRERIGPIALRAMADLVLLTPLALLGLG